MKNVILISGSAMHGKTTFANFLIQELEQRGNKCMKIAFADYLKFVATQYFKWDGKKNEEGRHLLQWLGTDVVRKEDEDFWSRIVFNTISVFKDQHDYFIIDDCRFVSEVKQFEMSWMPYIHVRVQRDNFDSGLTEEQKNHPSEIDLQNTKPDLWIYNKGSLMDLQIIATNLAIMLPFNYLEYFRKNI